MHKKTPFCFGWGKPRQGQRFPHFRSRDAQLGVLATNRVLRRLVYRQSSVAAYCPPLTPEHGFPSLHIGPDAGRSPSVRCGTRPARHLVFCPANLLPGKHGAKQKPPRAGGCLLAYPPYVGIIRIRSRVEACASSQPYGSPDMAILSHRRRDLSSRRRSFCAQAALRPWTVSAC